MEIIADMTRQYKSVEADLSDKINRLEQKKLQNADLIKDMQTKKQNLENDIKEIKKDGDATISDLTSNIDAMS